MAAYFTSCILNFFFRLQANVPLMINFILRKYFRGNLNKANSLVQIDVTEIACEIASEIASEIALFRFPHKIFLEDTLIH